MPVNPEVPETSAATVDTVLASIPSSPGVQESSPPPQAATSQQPLAPVPPTVSLSVSVPNPSLAEPRHPLALQRIPPRPPAVSLPVSAAEPSPPTAASVHPLALRRIGLPAQTPVQSPPTVQSPSHVATSTHPSASETPVRSSPAVRPPLSVSPWSPPPPPTPPHRNRHHHSNVARYLFRETPSAFTLPPELWLFLQNLDRRLEHLTNVVDDMRSTLASGLSPQRPALQSCSADLSVEHGTATHPPLLRQHSLNASSSNSEQTMIPDDSPMSPTLTHMQATPNSCGISLERLTIIRSEASSIMNFAVRILREICSSQELYGKNVTGVRGKEAVDPSKVEQVRSLVKKYYPAPPSEGERNWRECRKAMDSYLRKLPRPN